MMSITSSVSLPRRRNRDAVTGIAGGYFAEAGAVGAVNGTAACLQNFSTCPFDRKTIYLAFKESQNTL